MDVHFYLGLQSDMRRRRRKKGSYLQSPCIKAKAKARTEETDRQTDPKEEISYGIDPWPGLVGATNFGARWYDVVCPVSIAPDFD